MSHLPRLLRRVIQHAAVVARDDYERILAELQFVERAHDLADHPIELVQKITVRAALAGPFESRMRRERMMNVGRREVDEERLLAMPLHPSDRFLSQRCAEFLVAIQTVRRLAAGNAG